MKETKALFVRNVKLFFKDKGVFFTAMITPIILLVLYSTFLLNVFKDSFRSSFPEGFEIGESVINGLVGAQLISSLLAVSCITVTFCSNLMSVSDKVSGAANDFNVSPVKSSRVALGYFSASLFSSFLVGVAALAAGLVYLAFAGWYVTFADVLLMLIDVILLVSFGTALSSAINFFLSSQGQISAVGTIVSAGYGFICGAYMPISSFSPGLQKVLMFFPGTYGTSLIREHAMRGAMEELENVGVPSEVVSNVKRSIDCTIEFYGNEVSTLAKYAVLIGAILLVVAFYVFCNKHLKKKT